MNWQLLAGIVVATTALVSLGISLLTPWVKHQVEEVADRRIGMLAEQEKNNTARLDRLEQLAVDAVTTARTAATLQAQQHGEVKDDIRQLLGIVVKGR